MTPAEVIVTIGGVALIALVNWWFFGGQEVGKSGSQEVREHQGSVS